MRYLFNFAVVSLGFFVLVSCTKIPVLTHDFSVLKSDFFSRLIQEIVSVEGAFLSVDVSSGQALSEIEFIGSEAVDVYKYFYLADGGCIEISAEELECSALRVWRYVNVGGESYTSKQCMPGIRIYYKFHFSGKMRKMSGLSMSYRMLSFC